MCDLLNASPSKRQGDAHEPLRVSRHGTGDGLGSHRQLSLLLCLHRMGLVARFDPLRVSHIPCSLLSCTVPTILCFRLSSDRQSRFSASHTAGLYRQVMQEHLSHALPQPTSARQASQGILVVLPLMLAPATQRRRGAEMALWRIFSCATAQRRESRCGPEEGEERHGIKR